MEIDARFGDIATFDDQCGRKLDHRLCHIS
jgi:hypothetical protein